MIPAVLANSVQEWFQAIHFQLELGIDGSNNGCGDALPTIGFAWLILHGRGFTSFAFGNWYLAYAERPFVRQQMEVTRSLHRLFVQGVWR
jgi:hypothetical protein